MSENISIDKEKFFDRWAPNYDFLLTTVFYQAIHKRLLEYVELPAREGVRDWGLGAREEDTGTWGHGDMKNVKELSTSSTSPQPLAPNPSPSPSEQFSVLDLGCGTGRLLDRLATQFPTLQGIGLDLSAEMLRQAQQRNRHGQRLVYRQGNAEALPFAEGQFDAVFNTVSFLHYPNPQQVLSEVGRVLRPNGRFYLVDYTVREERGSGYLPVSPGGIRFYSPQRREQFGIAAGLECLGHYYLLGPVLLTVFSKTEV